MTAAHSPAPRAASPLGRIGISAHRGASHTHPENTLGAFRAALDAGAEGVELDIALSREGVPVVMHDGTVDRTTDGTGEVSQLSVDDLRALDAGGGEHVPTLAELLLLAEGRAEVNIELKDPHSAAAVLDVVAQHPLLTWFASSGQWTALEELRRLAPEARIYPLTIGVATVHDMRAVAITAGYDPAAIDKEFSRFSKLNRSLDDALAFAERIDAEGLSIWEKNLRADDVERIHRAGLAVWVWTINDPARAAELMSMGVDGICTDDPVTMLGLRAELGSSAG